MKTKGNITIEPEWIAQGDLALRFGVSRKLIQALLRDLASKGYAIRTMNIGKRGDLRVNYADFRYSVVTEYESTIIEDLKEKGEIA